MANLFEPTTIGVLFIVIGAIAYAAGHFRVAGLELDRRTAVGRVTLIFALLHILVGLVLIAIS